MKKAYIVTVDMGYGHQRASYPLKELAYGRVINANIDEVVRDEDRVTWLKMLNFYEKISRLKSIRMLHTPLPILPPPTTTPELRSRRGLTHSNSWTDIFPLLSISSLLQSIIRGAPRQSAHVRTAAKRPAVATRKSSLCLRHLRTAAMPAPRALQE